MEEEEVVVADDDADDNSAAGGGGAYAAGGAQAADDPTKEEEVEAVAVGKSGSGGVRHCPVRAARLLCKRESSLGSAGTGTASATEEEVLMLPDGFSTGSWSAVDGCGACNCGGCC